MNSATTRILGWLLSATLTAPLVLYGVLLFTEVDNFRGQIERHVSAALGRTIQFVGPITLERSLTPRLVIEGLSIANPDWASRPALALVERLKVKVRLLPLLQGELNILALEFHGVDLKLETGPEGSNNFTFVSSGRSSLLPAIEHLLLSDMTATWLPYEGMAKSGYLQEVTIRNEPRQPVELELATDLDGIPLKLALLAKPSADNWPLGPWETTIRANVGDLSVEVFGNVPQATEWYRGAYRLELLGESLARLGPLLGVDLPDKGPYRLGGNIRFNLNDYLVVSDLSGEIAQTELGGSMRWELGELERRPGSWQSVSQVGEFDLHARGRDALWQENLTFGGEPVRFALEQAEVKVRPGFPLEVLAQATLDDTPLAVNLRAPALAELVAKPQGPWRDLVLTAIGEGIELSLSGDVARPLEAKGFDLAFTLGGPGFARLLDRSGNFALAGHLREQTDRYVLDDISLRLDDTRITGRAAIQQSGLQSLSLLEYYRKHDLPTLLGLLELDVEASVPREFFDEPLVVAGHSLDVGLSAIRATVEAGQMLQLSAEASIEGSPIELALRAEPLEQLALNRNGPWRQLELKGQGEELSFVVQGDVEQPLEARGVDATIQLEGKDIGQLLPLFDLVLPLQGPYTLRGRFKNTAQSAVLDDVKINFGRSDIAGRAQFFPGAGRPRVEMDLVSEELYLMEFLPEVTETRAAAAAPRVIPDIRFPLDRMREIDARMRFSGKQLKTAAGELGGVSFALSLEQQKLSLDEFVVRGWAGARVEARGNIDAAQSPPAIDFQLTARELNYGALLQQAGLAESIAGMIDVTVTIAGRGHSGHELLSNANGKLILVGKQGRFGSRRLDLWGSDLVTTMLSPSWRREDVTELNCVVAHIGIDNGVASTDTILIDTNRITIGASGTLDLQSEKINVVFAPHPKRSSLVSLSNPAVVTGTLYAPEVEATVLPRRRLAAFGGGVLAGLLNPAFMVLTFSQLGSGSSDPCLATVEVAQTAKAEYFNRAR